MKKLLLGALAIGLSSAFAGCGSDRPPVDPEKAKTVHKYRGGGKRANESAMEESGQAIAPADEAAAPQ